MKIVEILKSEYTNKFANKTHVFLRALLYYYRDPNFRVIVLTRACVSGANYKFKKKYQKKLLLKYGVTVSIDAQIGKRFWMEHYNGVVIGQGAVIGDDCIFYQQVTIGQKYNKYPVISNGVIVYAGAKVIGDITIGDNAIIGANAVVLKDIPANSVVAGVPARVIRMVSE